MTLQGSRTARCAELVAAGLSAGHRLRETRALGVGLAEPGGEEEVLATLDPAARCIALAIGWATDEQAASQTAAALQHSNVVGLALDKGISQVLDADDLWESIVHDPPRTPPATCEAALGLVLSKRLPLIVEHVADIFDIADEQARLTFALGVGRLARRRQLAGLDLASLLLADPDVDSAMVGAVVRGMGDGLVGDGARWLADCTHRALVLRSRWTDAASRVASWLLDSDHGSAQDVMTVVLDAQTHAGDAGEELREWRDRLGGDDAASPWIQDLVGRWTRWPPSVRAALLDLAAEHETPLGSRWTQDTSEAVLVMGLTETASAEPEPGRGRLVRWLGHPSQRVRELAYHLLAPRRSLEVVTHPSPRQEDATVVALPSTSLAHSPLDCLRVALAGDEAEAAIPKLASLVAETELGEARRELVAALDVPDMAIRRGAIEALATIGTADDVPVLLEAARRLRGVAGLVASAVRRLGGDAHVQELAEIFRRRLRWADDEAVDQLVAMAGEHAGRYLTEALDTAFYPPVRSGAARAMARHGLRETSFALRTRSLTDPDADVRAVSQAALKELTGTVPPQGEVAGYALLTTPVDDLDEAVARAGGVGAQGLPGIRAALAQGTWRRRMAACQALAHVPGKAAFDLLLETLVDPDEDVRMAACSSLNASGWEPQTPSEITLAHMALRRFDLMLVDPDGICVDTLERGLQLGGHLFRSEVLATLETLGALRDWTLPVELEAAWQVVRLEPQDAIAAPDGLATLLRLIDRTWQLDPYRTILIQGLRTAAAEGLHEAYETDTWGWRAREAVCLALGRHGDESGIPLLAAHVLDRDEDVRSAAAQALVEVGTAAAARALAQGARSPFHDDADTVSAGLAAMGAPARLAIEELARSSWWESRRLAALVLRAWRQDRQWATDLALQLTVDPEYRVSEMAHAALLTHGLPGTTEATCLAVNGAQTLTIPGLLAHIPRSPEGRPEDDQVCTSWAAHIKELPVESLPARLGLAALLRIHETSPWLEALAEGKTTDHAGARLSAAHALRGLADATCRTCRGRATVSCVSCHGEGDRICQACDGQGSARHACPEPRCNATEVTRAIGSRACKTCRGRGYVTETCPCGSGRTPCPLCHGTSLLTCPACRGQGEYP